MEEVGWRRSWFIIPPFSTRGKLGNYTNKFLFIRTCRLEKLFFSWKVEVFERRLKKPGLDLYFGLFLLGSAVGSYNADISN